MAIDIGLLSAVVGMLALAFVYTDVWVAMGEANEVAEQLSDAMALLDGRAGARILAQDRGIA